MNKFQVNPFNLSPRFLLFEAKKDPKLADSSQPLPLFAHFSFLLLLNNLMSTSLPLLCLSSSHSFSLLSCAPSFKSLIFTSVKKKVWEGEVKATKYTTKDDSLACPTIHLDRFGFVSIARCHLALICSFPSDMQKWRAR